MIADLKKWMLTALAGIVALAMIVVPPATAAPGKLGGSLSVSVKSLTVDRTEQGTRIIAAVRVSNESRQIVRVPEFEVRAMTTDNISYTLQPGADNPLSINPLETVEMHYMLTVKRTDSFEISQLDWVQMNKNVYPRTETKLLTLAVTQNKTETRTWGAAFSLPPGPSQIVFTPVKLLQQSFLQGSGILIGLKVENKGREQGFVPDFLVEGQTNKKKYEAVKMAGARTVLEPGEKSHIYYRLQLDGKEELKSLNIMTNESFRDANANTVTYRPGWLKINIPNHLNKTVTMEDLPAYQRSSAIELDPENRLIPGEVEISLNKLSVKAWTTAGLKNMVAEFTVMNRGPVPLPNPEFAVELMSPGGSKYLGTLLPQEEPFFKFESLPDMDKTGAINPNVPYSVSYEFHLPVEEIGRQMGVVISDNKSLPPFRIPIASFQTAVQ